MHAEGCLIESEAQHFMKRLLRPAERYPIRALHTEREALGKTNMQILEPI